MSEQLTTCAECGMSVETNEYHPYAACLMFKACRDSSIVRENLNAVGNTAIGFCALILDNADKNEHPSDLADALRAIIKTRQGIDE